MSVALEPLLADGVIDAVLGQLKAGKEAEVWLVQHAGQVVAAKVYKERHARNFRNNVGYREGRQVRNSRTQRAIDRGSRFGQAAAEDAWKSAEADAIYALHAGGVRVPAPVMFYEGVLLMELVTAADGSPAPRMVEAPPSTPDEAHAMYLDLRSQIVRMLAADLIHGDLSPYNILMAPAGPTVIDFPQTVAAARNNRAEMYFRRDLENVREFLARIDPRLRGMSGDASEIWNAYVRRELTADFVPSGRHGGARPHAAPGERARRFEPHGARRGAPPELPTLGAPVQTGPQDPEAELKALEALVLRQGGGERGRPFAPTSSTDRGQRGPRRDRPPNRGGQNPGANRSAPAQTGRAQSGANPSSRNGARAQPSREKARPADRVAGSQGARPDPASRAQSPQNGSRRDPGPRGRVPENRRRDDRSRPNGAQSSERPPPSPPRPDRSGPQVAYVTRLVGPATNPPARDAKPSPPLVVVKKPSLKR